MTSAHSSKQYDVDLEAIRSRILLMGGLVESQLREALICFQNGDIEQAEHVIKMDESVNQLEVTLDAICGHLIVKHQPAANDLRTVMAAIKVIIDLERVGDEATKIARAGKNIQQRGIVMPQKMNHYDTIRMIAQAASQLLHNALDAFARLDQQLAANIIAQDAVIDYEFRSILRNLMTSMVEYPNTVSAAIETLWVAKAIERIGDHAKNIAEYVIYIVEGKDIRHTVYPAA